MADGGVGVARCPVTHGHGSSLTCYVRHGCRCVHCCGAMSAYRGESKGRLEPAIESAARIAVALRGGETFASLSRRAGVSAATLRRIEAAPLVHRVHRRTAKSIEDAVDVGCLPELPAAEHSQHAIRVMNRSTRLQIYVERLLECSEAVEWLVTDALVRALDERLAAQSELAALLGCSQASISRRVQRFRESHAQASCERSGSVLRLARYLRESDDPARVIDSLLAVVEHAFMRE